jgi:hypothetical protein
MWETNFSCKGTEGHNILVIRNGPSKKNDHITALRTSQTPAARFQPALAKAPRFPIHRSKRRDSAVRKEFNLFNEEMERPETERQRNASRQEAGP